MRKILIVRDTTEEMQIFSPRFNTAAYGRYSLRFFGPQLWSKLIKEEGNIGTLAAFGTMIRKKDVTSIVEGCGSECRLCLSNWTCVIHDVYMLQRTYKRKSLAILPGAQQHEALCHLVKKKLQIQFKKSISPLKWYQKTIMFLLFTKKEC